MSYIGNAKTPLIFASNTRDDIIPALKNDGTYEDHFTLSQEVPGGYESNVMVVRRRFITEPNTPNSSGVVFTKTQNGTTLTVTTTDLKIASVLNDIVPSSSNYEGDFVKINSTSSSYNNGKIVPVLSKTFDGTTLTITLDIRNIDLETQTGGTTSFNRCYYGAWEILDSEKDYSIVSGNGPETTNKVISFVIAPQKYDVVYVLHRGDATYNFVPSANSVGPEQLSHNLRNFVCDRYVATASQTDFTLSQEVVSSKAIIVFVNDVFKDGDDLENLYTDGTWSLGSDLKTIQFKSPLSAGTKVRILHLGFSTVTRRYGFFPGQQGATVSDFSITTNKIAIGAVTANRLANGSVSLEKLEDDSVNGSKILLENSEALRIKNTSGISQNVIQLDGNNIKVTSPGSSFFLDVKDGATLSRLSGSTAGELVWSSSTPSTKVSIQNTNQKTFDITISDTTSSLDSKTLPLKLVNNQGSVILDSSGCVGIGTNSASEKLDVSGNIKSSQSVIATNVQTSTINSIPVDQIGCPAGTIVMSAVDTAPAGWELCQGQVVDGSSTKYSKLYAAIGNKFGGSGTSFLIPDLRHRVPVGSSTTIPMRATSNEGIQNFELRQLKHNHTGGNHTHSISHTHSIPGHNHSISKYSTLEILNSGTHSTSISHEHTNISTNDNEGGHTHSLDSTSPVTSPYINSTAAISSARSLDNINTLKSLNHKHRSWPANNFNGTTNNNFNPNKIIGFNADQLPISGSTDLSSTSGAHNHNFPYSSWKKWTLGSGNYSLYAPDSTADQTNFISNGAHIHSVFSYSASWYVDNNYETLDHTHLLTGRTGSDSATIHKHNISSIKYFGSDTNGMHRHTSEYFMGGIGVIGISCSTTRPVVAGSTTIYLNTVNVGSTLNDIKLGYKIPSTFWGVDASVISINAAGGFITVSTAATVNIASGVYFNIFALSGDDVMTTSDQNTSISGPSTDNVTGDAVIPYIVLNFIIKL